MANTVLNIRVDESIKKSFDEFCDSVGINTSLAFNLFMRVVLRERRMPFEIGSVDKSAEASMDSSDDENLLSKQKYAVERFIENVNAITDEPL